MRRSDASCYHNMFGRCLVLFFSAAGVGKSQKISSSASVSLVSMIIVLYFMASFISAGVAFRMSGCVLSTCGVFFSKGLFEVRVPDGARIHVLEKKQKRMQRRLSEDVADVVQNVRTQCLVMGQ